MGEAGLPVDAHGRALRPIIAWFDTRAVDYARHWEETLGRARVYALSGMTVDGLFGANKAMWVRDHEPEVWERTAAWLSTEDWLILKLTGAPATDYSMAARTMLFDRTRLAWSAELLEAAGLEARLMPPAQPVGDGGGAGEPRGVGRDRAEGRHPGGPRGPRPHLCHLRRSGAARGARWIRPAPPRPSSPRWPRPRRGTRAWRLTSTAIRMWSRGAWSCWPRWAWPEAWSTGCAARCGELGDDVPDAYARMLGEMRLPLRPNGVMCFPQFGRGASPRFDPERARGAFVGLTAGHGRGDLLQAALEASCFSLRHNLDWVAEHLGKAAPRVRVLGGAVHIPLWLQLKATITGREFQVAAAGEPAALGAAVLAGVGAGVYPDHAAGVAAVAAAGAGLRAGRRSRPGVGGGLPGAVRAGVAAPARRAGPAGRRAAPARGLARPVPPGLAG